MRGKEIADLSVHASAGIEEYSLLRRHRAVIPQEVLKRGAIKLSWVNPLKRLWELLGVADKDDVCSADTGGAEMRK